MVRSIALLWPLENEVNNSNNSNNKISNNLNKNTIPDPFYDNETVKKVYLGDSFEN